MPTCVPDFKRAILGSPVSVWGPTPWNGVRSGALLQQTVELDRRPALRTLESVSRCPPDEREDHERHLPAKATRAPLSAAAHGPEADRHQVRPIRRDIREPEPGSTR